MSLRDLLAASRRLPAWALVMAIRGYRAVVSPLLPPSCRFTPSCSTYSLSAVEKYGVIRGGWLSVRRLARCHPWNPGGPDPVP